MGAKCRGCKEELYDQDSIICPKCEKIRIEKRRERKRERRDNTPTQLERKRRSRKRRRGASND